MSPPQGILRLQVVFRKMKNPMHIFESIQGLSIALLLYTSSCVASADVITFPNGATLAFSSPVTPEEQEKLGRGWKTAVYSNSDGQRSRLFPLEALKSLNGVLFDDSYPLRISPTGRYVVIDILRVGLLETGAEETARIQSRQYCPVLKTTSGCLVSNETGDLCGGEWDKRDDRWIVHGLKYDTNTPMVQYQFKKANTLWKEYSDDKYRSVRVSIRDLISSNLGIANLMACDPPKADNRDSYKNIQIELQRLGDFEDSAYISRELGDTVPSSMAH
ncbi:hypothetical protein QYH69_25675 [Paraburkholderia sp. SARCC-3016]|uniref:hypothetical protein n=1 Tax=Paraburkholderia sp. SARCC-3016 TaxID=3058611 RepID=UPI002809869C|nr:hypothetical protein [Paraburkholderia sp. SARCC-3016]MDQ7980633.1 hypothetical protein [Paraburkholderia sp. SARCC-3016]